MDRAIGQQQALLPRPPERRPVRVRGAEVRVPCVEVGVEVHERDRPVPSVHRAEERQRDRVVAPEREEVRRARRTSSAAASICDRLPMSNGLQPTSPASATCWAANGCTSRPDGRSGGGAWRCGSPAVRSARRGGRSRRCRMGCRGRRRRRRRRPRGGAGGRTSTVRRTAGRRAGRWGRSARHARQVRRGPDRPPSRADASRTDRSRRRRAAAPFGAAACGGSCGRQSSLP